MAAPQWAAFTALAGVVLALFLALARLSQGHVSDGPERRVAIRDDPAGLDPGITDSRPELTVSQSVVPELGGLPTGALLANVAATQGLFAIVVILGAVAFAIPATAFGAGDLLGDLTGEPMLVGVVAGVGLWFASEAGSRISDAAGIDHDETLRSLLAPDSLAGWLLLFAVILPIIAGVEELLFRAAAIGVVSAGFGVSPWAMAVLSSAAFGLGHGAQGTAGIVVTGLLGIVLAAAFVLTGSFVTVFVAHYLVNALEFLVHEVLDL